MAARATTILRAAEPLLLADLIVAECVYVLESFYEVGRERVALLMRAAIGGPHIETIDPGLLLRALTVLRDPSARLAEAYLVALAETTGANGIVSFDRSIDRVGTGARREP